MIRCRSMARLSMNHYGLLRILVRIFGPRCMGRETRGSPDELAHASHHPHPASTSDLAKPVVVLGPARRNRVRSDTVDPFPNRPSPITQSNSVCPKTALSTSRTTNESSHDPFYPFPSTPTRLLDSAQWFWKSSDTTPTVIRLRFDSHRQ